jgi:hypothetical protein
MTGNSSPSDVAAWMATELSRFKELRQSDAAAKIESRFGRQFTYENANGNLAIGPDVLKAFNKLTGSDVVWCRSGRYWRKREARDLPGRMQS